MSSMESPQSYRCAPTYLKAESKTGTVIPASLLRQYHFTIRSLGQASGKPCDFNSSCKFRYVPVLIPKTLAKMRKNYVPNFENLFWIAGINWIHILYITPLMLLFKNQMTNFSYKIQLTVNQTDWTYFANNVMRFSVKNGQLLKAQQYGFVKRTFFIKYIDCCMARMSRAQVLQLIVHCTHYIPSACQQKHIVKQLSKQLHSVSWELSPLFS